MNKQKTKIAKKTPKKVIHRKGRGKGQAFEREICRTLSLWVSKGTSKNLFWRSSQSGGRATTLRKKGENLSVHAGDIAAIDEVGKPFIDRFFVECKRYKSLHLDALCYNSIGTLGPMWKKCCKQAKQYGKEPILICKENGRDELICFAMTNEFAIATGFPVWCTFSRHNLCICLLVEFLKKHTFEDCIPARGQHWRVDHPLYQEDGDACDSHGRPSLGRKKRERI